MSYDMDWCAAFLRRHANQLRRTASADNDNDTRESLVTKAARLDRGAEVLEARAKRLARRKLRPYRTRKVAA
jgi:hypothetical protein